MIKFVCALNFGYVCPNEFLVTNLQSIILFMATFYFTEIEITQVHTPTPPPLKMNIKV